MTAAAHARHPLRELLTGLFRRRQPDLIPMRTVDYGDGPKIAGFWNERSAYPPHGWGGYGRDYPASTSQDSAGHALGQDLSDAGTGQGDGPPWDLAAPAASRRPGPDEPSGWYGMTVIDNPVTRTRPYAPEPDPEPAPEPEPDEPEPAPGPALASYPPPSFTADYRDLPAFKQAARVAGFAPAGLVRAAGVMIP